MDLKLNQEQQAAFDKIVASFNPAEQGNKLFFLHGPAGSGKTFLLKRIHEFAANNGLYVVPTSYTAIAASELSWEALTSHRTFYLGIYYNFQPFLDEQPDKSKRLGKADVILWDDICWSRAEHLENTDALLRYMANNDEPFGGKVVVFAGDFLSVPGTNDKETGFHKYKHWECVQPIGLTQSMRAQQDHFDFVLNIGKGTALASPETVCFADSLDALITSTLFPFDQMPQQDLSLRRILTTTRDKRDDLNRYILEKMPGELIDIEPEHITDEERSRGEKCYCFGDLKTLSLKKGAHVVYKNKEPKPDKPCYGSILRFNEMSSDGQRMFCTILKTYDKPGMTRNAPIELEREEYELPYNQYRHDENRRVCKQFKVRLSYASTIHNSLGQTFEKIGLCADDTKIRSHGLLYLALSRIRNKEDVRVYNGDGKQPIRSSVREEILQEMDM